jgi:hypothetical protein
MLLARCDRRLHVSRPGVLFERTALSRQPEEAIRHDLAQLRSKYEVSPDLLLKDLYVSAYSTPDPNFLWL